MATRVLVVGENGFIARNLMAGMHGQFEMTYTSRNRERGGECLRLDLEKPEAFHYESLSRDDTVLVLAAISSPDYCERQYESARAVNVIGTSLFIEGCIERGARVVFFSSDTVYGGDEHVVYDEASECRPVGSYGSMKREVEQMFLGHEAFKVVRLSYVLAGSDKFTKYLCQCAKAGSYAEVYHPFDRNVVYMGDVVDAIVSLTRKWPRYSNSVFNICGGETLSRLDIAEMVREQAAPSLRIRAVRPDESFFRARPRLVRVESLYLERLLGRGTTAIRDAIAKVLGEDRNRYE